MTTIYSVALEFSKIAKKLQTEIQRSVDEEGRVLRDAFALKTPASSGRLRQSWRIKKPTNAQYIAGVSVYNPQPYAGALSFGLPVSGNEHHPWVISVKKGTNTKLVETGGKIYSTSVGAGGIVGGIFTASYQQKMARRLADSVVRLLNDS